MITTVNDTVRTASGSVSDPSPNPDNTAPTISGTPASAVTVNTAYDFTPVASDADNDPLTFSVVGEPRSILDNR
jgi:hypothetical protein